MNYIVDMKTTIQISKELLNKLQVMKVYSKESYEDVIWDLIEDRMELSPETMKNIAEAEADIKAGRIHKWEDVKRELDIHV